MPLLTIAVIGCGTAGMAAAIYLARAGHTVTLYERFATPQPVGAGLLLQPSGIAVLRELDLLDMALAGGAVVHGLEGVNHTGRKVLSLRYQDLEAEYFGIGIHRARLFAVLYRAVRDAGVNICLGANIERVTQTDNTPTPGPEKLYRPTQSHRGLLPMGQPLANRLLKNYLRCRCFVKIVLKMLIYNP